jgi:hypothetical protein
MFSEGFSEGELEGIEQVWGHRVLFSAEMPSSQSVVGKGVYFCVYVLVSLILAKYDCSGENFDLCSDPLRRRSFAWPLASSLVETRRQCAAC